MHFSFDHLVFFLQKPEEAIFPLKQKGIHAVNGGHHEFWGTYNSLTYFGLSYIEFLGIENLPIAEKQENNRLITQIVDQLAVQGQEGPAKLAIRTKEIQQLAIQLKEMGYTVFGPFPGERVRADGVTIRWSLLFLEEEEGELTMPFFIEWEKPDEERLLELQQQGLIGSHGLGSPTFESVGMVVNNLEQSMIKWSKMLNLIPSEEFVNLTFNARCRKLELSGTSLCFYTPMGKGLADEILKGRGQTPFLVTMGDTGQSTLFELFGGHWKFQ